MASITKRKSKYSVVYDYYDEEGVRHECSGEQGCIEGVSGCIGK